MDGKQITARVQLVPKSKKKSEGADDDASVGKRAAYLASSRLAYSRSMPIYRKVLYNILNIFYIKNC